MAIATDPMFIFGGTFNPIHYGHINPILALHKSLTQFSQRVRAPVKITFLPNYISPLKTHLHQDIANKHRLAMLNIALCHYDAFTIDDTEMNQKGISYTVNTLSRLADIHGKMPVFIMGSDSLQQFHRWHEYQKLMSMCSFIVLKRPTQHLHLSDIIKERVVERLNGTFQLGHFYLFNNPQWDISSTQVREKIRNGEALAKYMPEAVIKYISNHKLYNTEV